MNNPGFHLGFIGLGIMGKPMATRLLDSGHALAVWARRPASGEPLRQRGAHVCDSIAELAQRCNVVFLCVSDTPDVIGLITGQDGLLHSLASNSIVIDMSTISPSATRDLATQLAAKDIDMLDAPVSGGERGAIDGTLSIMVGGKEAVLQRVKPLLNVLGKNIVHIGDHGAGQVAKACNQLLVAQTLVAIAEALHTAERAGVDPARVRDALLGGFANSKILEAHGQRMLDGNFQPGFKARLHHKDLNNVLAFARDLDMDLPGTELAAEHIARLVEGGSGELDSAAIYTLFK